MSDVSRRRIRALPLLVTAAGILSCAALAFAAVFLRPRSFATFSEAVGYVLDQRGVAYESVFIDRSWPDTVNDITYGANLLIVLPDKGTVIGRLDCRGWKKNCFVSVREFGIYREPLPELTEHRRLPWIAWIEQTLGIRF
ncbi:MAG: hypothetical protein RMJ55_13735 [Roseiflexaceae bacterium]|nr:hypothetical protein [Roseiflexaceae bacterium]MDW8234956.1 hypothetical protein [Roseiflexaceae bacterium]